MAVPKHENVGIGRTFKNHLKNNHVHQSSSQSHPKTKRKQLDAGSEEVEEHMTQEKNLDDTK